MKAVVAVCLSIIYSLSAEQTITCKKTYVNPNEVILEESSIFVHINNFWLRAVSLHTDAHGLYVIQDERIHGPWQCKKPGCLTQNEEWRDFCKQCGTPRG